jgi:probable rRNA maturation factor
MTPRATARGARPRNSVPRSTFALAVQYGVEAAGLPVRATLRRWATAALSGPAAVTLRFVGTREGRMLNARFRGKDGPTNVLTFVYDDVVPLTGDIVLCVPVVRGEARRQHITLTAHCAHLVVHGLLHLQGFDHDRPRAAARMEAREKRILASLGYPDPYAPRAPGTRAS